MDNEKKLLDTLSFPADLKGLTPAQEKQLAEEIRAFLVEKVTTTGGHLASNLGVVELSIALHKILNTPKDRIIWDVGHQSYVHKILTGRKDRFDTLRAPGGLAGFPKRSESEFDAFGTGHSSTALSAAVGFARADALAGRDNFTVAVVGDGAFTGGLVHEALNNLSPHLRLIIILNENEMSISKNIGVFSRYIAKIRSRRGYFRTKSLTRTILTHIPLIGKPMFNLMSRIKRFFKDNLFDSNYFENLGLRYLGPADGNNIEVVETLLREALSKQSSVLIHLKTVKGKGYAPAEKNPDQFHAVLPAGADQTVNFSAEFGRLLCERAETDPRILAITAAMADGCGLARFARLYPERFFDVGIAEDHALVFAAGLAAGGYRPVAAIYSSFLQRSYDAILHDIALQRLPVTVMIDRASLACGDGPTHHGIFDVSFLNGIPNIVLYAPATFASLAVALDRALAGEDPVFIRYPNTGDLACADRFCHGAFGLYASFLPTDPVDAVILTYGKVVTEAVAAADALAARGLTCGILLVEQLKPLPLDRLLPYLAETTAPLVILEEGIRSGGFGTNLMDALARLPADRVITPRPIRLLAIDDHFAESCAGKSLYQRCGLARDDILAAFAALGLPLSP